MYLERHRVDGAWAHRSMGNAIHNALRDWFDDDARTPATAADLVRKGWIGSGFRDAEQSADWREASAAMVERYCAGRPAVVPFSRERTLGTLTESVTVTGRIDRLDEKGDELVVVDYKTGSRVPTDDDARVSRALAIYAVAVQRCLKRPTFEVQLHHVPSGVVASHRHTGESLQRQLDRVDSIGRDIATAIAVDDDSAFPPSPGPLCGWCDHRDLCPASSGIPAVPRWAGLPVAGEEPHADEGP